MLRESLATIISRTCSGSSVAKADPTNHGSQARVDAAAMRSLVLITHGRICRVPWHSASRVRRAGRYSVAPEHAQRPVSNRSGAEPLGRYHAEAHRRRYAGTMVWVGARYPNECGAGAVGIARSGWSLFAGRGWSRGLAHFLEWILFRTWSSAMEMCCFTSTVSTRSFETATLDAARLADGLRFGGQTVLFSWPSRNKLFDYIADRESAMWSRDALETTLDSLVARITVITSNDDRALAVVTGLSGRSARGARTKSKAPSLRSQGD